MMSLIYAFVMILAPVAAGALLLVLTAAAFVLSKAAIAWLMRIWEDL